ncbi:MAG: hypothetical protein J6U05_02460, partial [Neisseriaceae bacterium]|nr:hypothetical protein [Neisseriaceae bacterium]
MSRKQQAQLSLDRENLDAQLEAAAQKRKKAKRKKIIVRVVVIGIVVVVLLAIGAGILGVIMSKKSMEQMVNVTHVESGELTQEVK